MSCSSVTLRPKEPVRTCKSVIRLITPFNKVVHHTLFDLPLFNSFHSKYLLPQIKLRQLLLLTLTKGVLEFRRLILSMYAVTL